MADEKELTPEEKLLQVIQKGEKTPSPPQATSGPGIPDTTQTESAGSAVMSEVVPPMGKGRELVFMNRIFAFAAVVFLCLAGYETYLNVPARATVYQTESMTISQYTDDADTMSMADAQDLFARRRIFGSVERGIINTGNTNVINFIGWRAYARDHLSLMGTSEIKRSQDGHEQSIQEAIVMDNKLKKMLFLRPGSTVVLAEQEVTVATVDETAVELKKDDQVLRIE